MKSEKPLTDHKRRKGSSHKEFGSVAGGSAAEDAVARRGLNEVWANILGRVSTLVNPQAFQTWFEPMKLSGYNGETIIIEGPNQFFIDWVAEHHIENIREAAKSVVNRDVVVEFIAPESQGRSAAAEIEKPAPRSPATEPAARDINLNSRYVFDEFVVGPGNRLTHAAAKAVSENPALAYNPLFIYGGAGLGKTHLIQAIGHYVLKNHPLLKISYVSAENFMNELIHAIRSGSTLKFKKKYRNIDILLIDDVHFLAGKESTQEEFFFTFNALHDANKQIVVTSDRPPKEIPTLQERLTSRFEWGLITDIQPPDLETRIAILRKKVRKECIEIPDSVITMIAENVKSNIRELEGSLIRILASASLTRREINPEMAEEVLEDLISRSSARTTIEDIQKAVSEKYDIPVARIKSKTRTRDVVRARMVAIYLSREITECPLMKIGKKFGGRDHSTVLHAIKRIEKSLRSDSSLERAIQDIRGRLIH